MGFIYLSSVLLENYFSSNALALFIISTVFATLA